MRDLNGLHTLGAAAYLDAPSIETIDHFKLDAPRPGQYTELACRKNITLRYEFSSLYAKLQAAFDEKLGDTVRYADGKALPGFHIYSSRPEYSQAASHVPHYDRQYETIDWGKNVQVGSETTLSFTLTLQQPSSGAGLHVWDVELEDILKMGKAEAVSYIRKAECRKEAYHVGELFCHPGHTLHRIAPWEYKVGEYRITLQGHAIHIDGHWQLYW
ncbi:hypothetical protein [Halioglobus sp. HI00S01]|uniref:hypothetical protein n=1 Tax=Halioglobus sp. HI00S01 TaxID=1822214 RepID=UPI0012E95022|nr:hypothetical protein [Halioglobus sp. HI00S01]